MTDMSTCNKCGARYPSAPAYLIHKCHCDGGMMIRDDPYGKIHTDGSRSGGQPLDDSIEAKALALVNEVEREEGEKELTRGLRGLVVDEALCRAIEQHEAFKQEVSDALVDSWYHNASGKLLERFIIPKSKPDPLLDIVEWLGGPVWGTREEYVKEIHKALEARGLEIREKNDD